MEQGWCPRTLDLSPTGESARFWGRESPCRLKHPRPYGEKMSMDLVWWLHLGHDTEPRSSREWLSPQCTGLRIYLPCWARFDAFLDAVDLDREDMERLGYVVMVPGFDEPRRLLNEHDWLRAMIKIWEELDWYEKLWCLSPPPVMIFCTAEQAARCAESDWIDCVAREAALTLEAAHQSETSDESASENEN